MQQRDWIAILDFGSQYTHLIARRVRELGVYSEILPHDVSATDLKTAKGIILSGGPQSVAESNLRPDEKIYTLAIPILGLCFGHQLLAQHFGGKLHQSKEREYGEAALALSLDSRKTSPLLEGLDAEEIVWMSHGDSVERVPDGFRVLAHTPTCPVAVMENFAEQIYGLQFHPEVTHTEHGMHMLQNFVFGICGAQPSWNAAEREHILTEKVKAEVGERKVFLLVSGGVDSTVAFAFLTRVLGKERVRGLFIDTGFMRLNEVEEIAGQFKEMGYDNIEIIDAQKDFVDAVRGIHDPEEKRKRIGKMFLDVAERIRTERGYVAPEWVLAQGTIYPDTIESGGTQQAEVIKTHHNRVGEAQEMIANKELIEPVVDLYKDEVRELGERLGLPDELIHRQPFPGPGLAIRIITQQAKPLRDLEERMRITAKDIDAFFTENAQFAILPVQSVGVQGDQRTYAHPLAISTMIDWEPLRAVSRKLLTSFKAINRVVVLLNPQSGVLEKGEPVSLDVSEERLDLLRNVDAIVQDFFITNGVAAEIWQTPVVLIPFGFGLRPSVVIRPVVSREAMTVTPFKLTQKMAEELVQTIEAASLPIAGIFYDITDKPPGTIEWE
ncbi:MAG: glutamine-hydrolyzing GMP synthase [Patescibacteria group bacterium]|jgi:GMP synthase (glutamine-hydrolysing)